MKKKLTFLISSTLLLWACSNESPLEDSQTETNEKVTIPELNLSLDVDDGRFVFEDETAFQNAVNAFKTRTNDAANLRTSSDSDEFLYEAPAEEKPIAMKDYGFHSLFDEFEAAMSEAESYYDREDGYEEFKEKYASLFFPEEGDDYSAYLPVSDNDVAKLLNKNGEVVIGGEIVTLKDINSYEHLEELGLTPPENENELISLRYDSPDNVFRKKLNNRKLWIKKPKIRTKYVFPYAPGTSRKLVNLEVCFRKKGFWGKWYNYSSITELWLNHKELSGYYLNYFQTYDNGYAYYRKREHSSHDYEWETGPSGTVRFKVDGFIKFRGFGSTHGQTKFPFSVDAQLY